MSIFRKIFFVFLLILISLNARQKIIKKSDDNFTIIDLNQNFKRVDLHEQKGFFDSSILIKKYDDKAFKIFIFYNELFGFMDEDNFTVPTKIFAPDFAKNLFEELKNELKDFDFVPSRPGKNEEIFLKRIIKNENFLELKKDKNVSQKESKLPPRYALVFVLDFFSIDLWEWLWLRTREAHVRVKFYFYDFEKRSFLAGKIISAKINIKDQNSTQATQASLTQIPQILSETLKKEIEKVGE